MPIDQIMNIYCSVVIPFLLSTFSAVINAKPVMPDSGLIMREISKLPPPPQKPIDTQIDQSSLKKPMAAQSNLHITVRSFRFSGNSQVPASTLQTLLNHYLNRDLSFNDLQQATDVVTEYYRQEGFLHAYAYLPEQTLELGQVELVIFEGQRDDQHFEK